MNIVYIVTDSYVPMLGISMTSLLENTRDLDELIIYILADDLSSNNKMILSDLVKKAEREIVFINVNGYKNVFNFKFDTQGFHSIVLARLLLSKYLKKDINKVLYLDCDTIINGSIKELEMLELQNMDYAIAAVPELSMPLMQKKIIGLEKKEIYYNCGVLLINLEYWRRNKLQEKFIEYYKKKQGQLLYNDQDILNHCCRKKILTISQKYNFAPVLKYFPRYFIKRYQPTYFKNGTEEYKQILKNPTIIHFLGEERPWVHGNYSPYRKVYEKYKNRSLWKNEQLVYGKERLLFYYHILNLVTLICPWFRVMFTRWIGIYYYEKRKKS